MAGGFCVITTTAIADGTRGALTRWMLEPAPGVYVGTLTARVREELWNGLCESIDEQSGWAVLVHGAATEQGFTILTHGEGSRTPRQIDGLTLIGWPRAESDEHPPQTAFPQPSPRDPWQDQPPPKPPQP